MQMSNLNQQRFVVPMQSRQRRRVPVPPQSSETTFASSLFSNSQQDQSNAARIERYEQAEEEACILDSNHDIRFRWRLVWRPGADESDDRWAAPLHAGIKNECLVANFAENDQNVDSANIARILVGQLTPVAADVEFYRLVAHGNKMREVPVSVDWWKCIHYGNDFQSPTLRLALSYNLTKSEDEQGSAESANLRKTVVADWSIALVQRVFNVTKDTVDEWRHSLDRGSAQISPARENFSVDIPVGAYLCSCNGCVCQDGQRGPIELLQQQQQPNNVCDSDESSADNREPTHSNTVLREPVVERVPTSSIGHRTSASHSKSPRIDTEVSSAQQRQQQQHEHNFDYDTSRIRVWLQFNEVSSHRGANPDSTRTFSFLGKFQGLFWLRASLSGSDSEPVWSRGPLITLEKFGEKYRSLLQRYNAGHLVGRRPRPSEAPRRVLSQDIEKSGRKDRTVASCGSNERLQKQISTGEKTVAIEKKEEEEEQQETITQEKEKEAQEDGRNARGGTLIFVQKPTTAEKETATENKAGDESPARKLKPQCDNTVQEKDTKVQKKKRKKGQNKSHEKITAANDKTDSAVMDKEQSKIGVEPILLRSTASKDDANAEHTWLFQRCSWEFIEKSDVEMPLYGTNDGPIGYAIDLHFSLRVRNQSTVSLFNIDLIQPMVIHDWQQSPDDDSTLLIGFSWKRSRQRQPPTADGDFSLPNVATEQCVTETCKLWLEARTCDGEPLSALKVPVRADDCGAMGASKFRISLPLYSLFAKTGVRTSSKKEHEPLAIDICLSRNGETTRKPLTCRFGCNRGAFDGPPTVISQWNLLPDDARRPQSQCRELTDAEPQIASGKRKQQDLLADELSMLFEPAPPKRKKQRGQATTKKKADGGLCGSGSPQFLSSRPVASILDECDPVESDDDTLERVLHVLQTSRRESSDYSITKPTVESLCAQRDLLLSLAWRYRRKLAAERAKISAKQ